MTSPISPDDWEILSAYLDGQVSARENDQIRLRLEAQPELQRALEELRRTKMVLRSVPHKRVPRNFTLTRAMVPQRKPWFRLIPSLSFASGLATLLLVLSFAFEFLPGLNNSFQPLAAQAPAATAFSGQSPQALSAPRASDTNPSTANQGAPIVIWNSGATGLGGGGGGSGGGAPDQASPALGIGGGPTSIAPETSEPLPTELGQVEGTPPAISGSNPSIAAAPTATPPGSKSQPEATVAPAPTEVAPPQVLATPAPTEPAPLNGTGPILGIRPTQEMGKIVVDQGADQALRELAAQPPARKPTAAPSFFARNLVPIQIGLVVLALIAGLAAFFLARRL